MIQAGHHDAGRYGLSFFSAAIQTLNEQAKALGTDGGK
jgi:hypothetical protein